MQGSAERLPWLTDEPAVRSPRSAPPMKRAKAGPAMWPWYLLFALLLVMVGAGAWWLGTRQQPAAAPELPAEAPFAIPVTQVQPGPVEQEEEALTPPQEVAEAAPAESTPEVLPTPAPPPRVSARGEERQAVGPSAEAVEAERERLRPVFPADETITAPPPITGPQPIVVYHPQPYRGRVVQLGAFPTRQQAEETWRKVTRRYPYLASKPKMVNTVDVRAFGGKRRTRMYRLQLGTSSQAQSVVICQQLERSGQSCVVVY